MSEERSTCLAIAVQGYDGPFDVLISLLRRNQWSIDDLPVLEITRQFLEHIRAATDLDPELGEEFVETASWLVLLKSRSLLPSENGSGPTPQEELRRALVDHETLAAAAGFLRERSGGTLRPASAGAPAGRHDPVLPPQEDGPSLQDVVRAAMEAVAAARAAAVFQKATEEPTVTVEDQIGWISAQLGTLPALTAVSTAPWFDQQPTPEARIALLLGLLELARTGVLILHQAVACSPIAVKAVQNISVGSPPA